LKQIEIRLSGSGGQGLILGGRLLMHTLMLAGYYVAQSQSYEPTSRGGLSRSDLVASESPVEFPLATELDMIIVLDQVAVEPSRSLIRPGGLVFSDSQRVTQPLEGEFNSFEIPFHQIAREQGNPRGANIVALGLLVELGRFATQENLQTAIEKLTPQRFRSVNSTVAQAGKQWARDLDLKS
jgi:2-oxoglutarate ferredoxin oxidoreductase subunit gamma|tara:strand:+ start:8699 stop:9244 length:546 start_codon:yes stop_codon:yes gene_type:complete